MIDGVDGNAMVEALMNSVLLKSAGNKTKPVIKLLNKYGIYGTKAAAFIMEFTALTMNLNQQEGKQDE